MSEIIPPIFKKDWRERRFFKKDWRERRSLKKIDGSDSLFFMIQSIFNHKNDRFDRKTDDQIPNPDHSTSWQGWEFDLLIFWSLKTINRDWSALDYLLKRSIVIELIPLILSIFKKDWQERFDLFDLSIFRSQTMIDSI